MTGELGTNKSICILATVVVCFAILWPGIFYPMLKGSLSSKDDIGCCDILLEKDVNSVNLVTELCGYVLQTLEMSDSLYIRARKLNTTVVKKCSSIILNTCSVDISTLLSDNIQLGQSYKNVLEEIRAVNKSLCLKYNFGVDLKLIGVPHRIKEIFDVSNRLKQERQIMYPKPESLHPALKERGRAITESHKVPRVSPEHRVSQASQNHFEIPSTAKRPPIPGMRPPMGAGMQTPVQAKGSGVLGILMPVYTIGIVVFFAYTIIRLMNKKQAGNEPNYAANDPTEFRKAMYDNVQQYKIPEKKPTNLSNGTGPSPQFVVSAFSGLLEEVNRELLSEEEPLTPINEDKEHAVENNTTITTEQFNSDDGNISDLISCCCPVAAGSNSSEYSEKNNTTVIIDKSKECNNNNGSVRVIGMETTESSESGKEWKSDKRDLSSLIDALEKEMEPIVEVVVPSQSIILPGKLQSDSKVLVTNTYTDVISGDSSVVESKVTLSVISPLLVKQENEENLVEEVTFIKDDVYDEERVENEMYDYNEDEDNVQDGNSNEVETILSNNIDEQTNEVKNKYDEEIDEAADDLNEEIDEATDDLNGEIDEAADDLDAEIDEAADDLDAEIDEAADDLDAEIDEAADDLDAEIDEAADDLDAETESVANSFDDNDNHLNGVIKNLNEQLLEDIKDNADEKETLPNDVDEESETTNKLQKEVDINNFVNKEQKVANNFDKNVVVDDVVGNLEEYYERTIDDVAGNLIKDDDEQQKQDVVSGENEEYNRNENQAYNGNDKIKATVDNFNDGNRNVIKDLNGQIINMADNLEETIADNLNEEERVTDTVIENNKQEFNSQFDTRNGDL